MDEAIACYRKAIKVDPKYVQAQCNLVGHSQRCQKGLRRSHRSLADGGPTGPALVTHSLVAGRDPAVARQANRGHRAPGLGGQTPACRGGSCPGLARRTLPAPAPVALEKRLPDLLAEHFHGDDRERLDGELCY